MKTALQHFQTMFRLFHLALLGSALVAPVAALPALAQTAPTAQQASRPFLNSLFSDNAVLQRDRVIPVWGWTAPGAAVRVKLDDKTTSAVADASGRWTAHIGPVPAGGPHTLSVSGAGIIPQNVSRSNILFGDIWLCSGQSNMEFGVGNLTNADQEIAAANYPQIRLFTVPKLPSRSPVQSIESQWLECNPTNIKQGAWGGFSAVAYFFGRKLNQELHVPIGLIHSSWGGTPAEAWVSESSLGTLPDFQGAIAATKVVTDAPGAAMDASINTWLAANAPGYNPNWMAPEGDETGWKTLAVPGLWETAGVPELAAFDGVALFRRSFDVPAAWAGKDLTLSLGAVDDNDATYWNGTRVGGTAGYQAARTYTVPGALVKAGRNTLAVRVTDTGGGGGFYSPAGDLKLSLDGANSLPLGGAWKYRIAVAAAQMGAMPRAVDQNDPNRVDVLYNGMISPLLPYGLKGAIWYQGESNAGRAEQYSRLLPALIGDWRKQFDTPMPFYIVQLAGFMAPDDAPQNDGWPQLRAAQMKTAMTVPDTGIAITTDVGDEKDIHPKNKQDVGLRLALAALAKTYGRAVESSGPTVKSVTPGGDSITVAFDHANGGLQLKGDAARVFAVAGADGIYSWATPRIEGSNVVLTSPTVAKPLFVRYAWSNLPRATLYNGANLPAPPFQTAP